MYTRGDLIDKVKRRIRQLAADTDSLTEKERGNLLSDAAIIDGINAGRKQLMIAVQDAELWGKVRTVITTLTNTQEYDLGSSLLRVLRVLYDMTEQTVTGAYDATVTHTASAEMVSGFTGLSVNAYAGGTIHVVKSAVYYSALIASNTDKDVTLNDGTALPALSDDPALLRVAPAVTRSSNTREMVDLKTASMEEAAIRDPLNAPSATNPKYRMTNSKIRLVVSTDGSVTAGKAVEVEYLKELTDLATDATQTGLTNTFDEMVVDWAVFATCSLALPAVAAISVNEFYRKASIINGRK